jgi:hypothetical protein
MWLMCVYYLDELTLGKSKMLCDENESARPAGLASPLLLELLMLAIHPLPNVHGVMTVYAAILLIYPPFYLLLAVH